MLSIVEAFIGFFSRIAKCTLTPDFRYVGESQKGNSYQLNAAQNIAFPSFMY